MHTGLPAPDPPAASAGPLRGRPRIHRARRASLISACAHALVCHAPVCTRWSATLRSARAGLHALVCPLPSHGLTTGFLPRRWSALAVRRLARSVDLTAPLSSAHAHNTMNALHCSKRENIERATLIGCPQSALVASVVRYGSLQFPRFLYALIHGTKRFRFTCHYLSAYLQDYMQKSCAESRGLTTGTLLGAFSLTFPTRFVRGRV